MSVGCLRGRDRCDVVDLEEHSMGHTETQTELAGADRACAVFLLAQLDSINPLVSDPGKHAALLDFLVSVFGCTVRDDRGDTVDVPRWLGTVGSSEGRKVDVGLLPGWIGNVTSHDEEMVNTARGHNETDDPHPGKRRRTTRDTTRVGGGPNTSYIHDMFKRTVVNLNTTQSAASGQDEPSFGGYTAAIHAFHINLFRGLIHSVAHYKGSHDWLVEELTSHSEIIEQFSTVLATLGNSVYLSKEFMDETHGETNPKICVVHNSVHLAYLKLTHELLVNYRGFYFDTIAKGKHFLSFANAMIVQSLMSSNIAVVMEANAILQSYIAIVEEDMKTESTDTLVDFVRYIRHIKNRLSQVALANVGLQGIPDLDPEEGCHSTTVSPAVFMPDTAPHLSIAHLDSIYVLSKFLILELDWNHDTPVYVNRKIAHEIRDVTVNYVEEDDKEMKPNGNTIETTMRRQLTEELSRTINIHNAPILVSTMDTQDEWMIDSVVELLNSHDKLIVNRAIMILTEFISSISSKNVANFFLYLLVIYKALEERTVDYKSKSSGPNGYAALNERAEYLLLHPFNILNQDKMKESLYYLPLQGMLLKIVFYGRQYILDQIDEIELTNKMREISMLFGNSYVTQKCMKPYLESVMDLFISMKPVLELGYWNTTISHVLTTGLQEQQRDPASYTYFTKEELNTILQSTNRFIVSMGKRCFEWAFSSTTSSNTVTFNYYRSKAVKHIDISFQSLFPILQLAQHFGDPKTSIDELAAEIWSLTLVYLKKNFFHLTDKVLLRQLLRTLFQNTNHLYATFAIDKSCIDHWIPIFKHDFSDPIKEETLSYVRTIVAKIVNDTSSLQDRNDYDDKCNTIFTFIFESIISWMELLMRKKDTDLQLLYLRCNEITKYMFAVGGEGNDPSDDWTCSKRFPYRLVTYSDLDSMRVMIRNLLKYFNMIKELETSDEVVVDINDSQGSECLFPTPWVLYDPMMSIIRTYGKADDATIRYGYETATNVTSKFIQLIHTMIKIGIHRHSINSTNKEYLLQYLVKEGIIKEEVDLVSDLTSIISSFDEDSELINSSLDLLYTLYRIPHCLTDSQKKSTFTLFKDIMNTETATEVQILVRSIIEQEEHKLFPKSYETSADNDAGLRYTILHGADSVLFLDPKRTTEDQMTPTCYDC